MLILLIDETDIAWTANLVSSRILDIQADSHYHTFRSRGRRWLQQNSYHKLRYSFLRSILAHKLDKTNKI